MKQLTRSTVRHADHQTAKKEKGSSESVSRAILIGTLIAIIPAAIGYCFSFIDGLRKDDLAFTNKQIEQLYGPLLAVTQANDATWGFAHGSKPLFANKDLPADRNQIVWRIWMKTVFQPLNEKVETAIINNYQLILGKATPKSFQNVIAQTEAYKAIINGWGDKNDPDSFEAYTKTIIPGLKYSSELSSCVAASYKMLKDRQEALEKSPFNYFFSGRGDAPPECEVGADVNTAQRVAGHAHSD